MDREEGAAQEHRRALSDNQGIRVGLKKSATAHRISKRARAHDAARDTQRRIEFGGAGAC